MSELLRGARDFGRGLSFLTSHPSLWGWVIAPAVVTLLLMIGVVAAAVYALGGLTASATSWLPDWLAGLAGAGLEVLLAVALLAAGSLLFVSVAGAIAGPFCEMLSEAVEEQLTGRPGAPFSFGAFLRELLVGLGHSARRLLTSLAGAVGLFALSLIPLAGAVAALGLAAVVSARAAAYDCYDAVLARRGLAYDQKAAFLAKHRSRTVGLGAVVAALLLVPGVNLVVLGIGAAGATLAARDLGV